MKSRDVEREQTRGEEIASSVAHGVGAALAAAALAFLIVLASAAGDPWRLASFSIYGASLVLLYVTSTLYHSFRSPRVKRVFRVLDHSSIYLLIAGTYTPFALVNLRGPWGWSLLGVIWGLAVAGIGFKCFSAGRRRFESGALYLAMGWLGVIAFRPTLRALGVAGLAWVAAGGVAYTLGTVFYAWDRLRYGHFVWHLFVLAGSALHFVAILLYVLPAAAR